MTHAQSSGKMKKDNRVSHVQSDSVNEEDIGSVRKYEVEKVRDCLITLSLTTVNQTMISCPATS